MQTAGQSLDTLIARIEKGDFEPVYLLQGDTVLAEPTGRRLAEALARRAGGELATRRRPPRITPILTDLRTYSLFGGGRVVLVVESAVLADASAVAALIDEIEEALPVDGEAGLDAAARQAGGRLLQALRLHGIDPLAGDPEQTLERLPDAALHGAKRAGRRRRGSRQIATLRQQLAVLLGAARRAELQGWDDSEVSELGRLVQGGLPDGHALVLVERDVAAEHPLVKALEERGAYVRVGEVAVRRGGWDGLGALADELARDTGVRLDRSAAEELARRTLRTGPGYGEKRASADSTSRFAAEYRKLAALAGDGAVGAEAVRSAVADRGDEDVWKLLDALGDGRTELVLERCERLVRGADDPFAARLSLFALLAGTCRTIAAVAGLLEMTGAPRGERNYGRFQSRIASRLKADLPDGLANPLAGLHPFRLHRAYLAACRIGSRRARQLPWHLLETERRLKGDSDRPDVALAELMATIAS